LVDPARSVAEATLAKPLSSTHRLVTRVLQLSDRLIIRLATTGLLVAHMSVAGASGAPADAQHEVKAEHAQKEEVAVEETTTAPQTTREKVKSYFEDTPILYRVARCESRWRHYDGDGSVLRGNVNANDVGVMQINERYHLQTAKSLGYNIYTLEGNMKYAQYLHRTQGLQPWSASRECWSSQHIARK